jgi:hypothetical protein
MDTDDSTEKTTCNREHRVHEHRVHRETYAMKGLLSVFSVAVYSRELCG